MTGKHGFSNTVFIYSEQEEANSRLAKSEAEKMSHNLAQFDSKFSTLIDYFAIIGSDNGQLRKLINELVE